MKQFFLAVGVSVIAVATVNAQSKPKSKTPVKSATGAAKPTAAVLKNPLDSFSYALGLNIAKNLKAQGIENVSSFAMQKAMGDIFAQRAVLLNDQQANQCIQQSLQANMSKKNGAEKEKGLAFLEANKKRPGVTTLPSGLQYEVMVKGDQNSATPKIVDTVIAHYRGTLIDGKPFDNSYDRGEPLTIPVGSVIKGWTEALQLMHKGDKWKVFIPSELGYGERGAGADIPGGAALIFEMELLSILPAAPPAAPAADTTQPKQ